MMSKQRSIEASMSIQLDPSRSAMATRSVRSDRGTGVDRAGRAHPAHAPTHGSYGRRERPVAARVGLYLREPAEASGAALSRFHGERRGFASRPDEAPQR